VEEPFPGFRFAGITDVERLGYGVEENGHRLHRLAFVELRCMFVCAGHLVSTPEWEIKILLARHLYEDAEHHHALRARIGELRRSDRSLDRCPDQALEALMDEAIRARSTVELMTGLYRVIKPALVAAYRHHLDHITPLVDYPTGRLLRQLLLEEEQHIALGQQYLDLLLTVDTAQAADAWAAHLTAYLAAAGGLAGEDARLPAAGLPPARRDEGPWQPSIESARDSRFSVSVPKEPCIDVPSEGNPTREGLEEMMWVRFHEMSPAEAVALIMSQQQGMPWAFYHDLARHCWDEVRHACFGQAALQAEGIDITSRPNWTGWVTMTQATMAPMEAYTHLTVAIEQAAMKYPPGKRQEYEYCRDTAKHALMALYQDYDWADEVNHAQFGQTWIVRGVHDGDRHAAIAAGEETRRRRAAYFANYPRSSSSQPGASLSRDERLDTPGY
jgi:hypothetical protein